MAKASRDREIENRIRTQLGDQAYKQLCRDVVAAERVLKTIETIAPEVLRRADPRRGPASTTDLVHEAHTVIESLIGALSEEEKPAPDVRLTGIKPRAAKASLAVVEKQDRRKRR